MEVLIKLLVEAKYGRQVNKNLKLMVIRASGLYVLGRVLLKHFHLDRKNCKDFCEQESSHDFEDVKGCIFQ